MNSVRNEIFRAAYLKANSRTFVTSVLTRREMKAKFRHFRHPFQMTRLCTRSAALSLVTWIGGAVITAKHLVSHQLSIIGKLINLHFHKAQLINGARATRWRPWAPNLHLAGNVPLKDLNRWPIESTVSSRPSCVDPQLIELVKRRKISSSVFYANWPFSRTFRSIHRPATGNVLVFFFGAT